MVEEVLEAEVDADGREIALLELIVCEAAEEGALADWAVPDDDDLEEIVVFPDHGRYYNSDNSDQQKHQCQLFMAVGKHRDFQCT
jgi:hypothetical protein